MHAGAPERRKRRRAVHPAGNTKRKLLLPPTNPGLIEQFERDAMHAEHDRVMAKMEPLPVEEADPWLLEALNAK